MQQTKPILKIGFLENLSTKDTNFHQVTFNHSHDHHNWYVLEQVYVNDLVNRYYLGPPSISPPYLCSGCLIVFIIFYPHHRCFISSIINLRNELAIHRNCNSKAKLCEWSLTFEVFHIPDIRVEVLFG